MKRERDEDEDERERKRQTAGTTQTGSHAMESIGSGCKEGGACA